MDKAWLKLSELRQAQEAYTCLSDQIAVFDVEEKMFGGDVSFFLLSSAVSGLIIIQISKLRCSALQTLADNLLLC